MGSTFTLSLSLLIPMQFHLSLLHVSSHYSLAVSALSLSLSKILSLSSLIFREFTLLSAPSTLSLNTQRLDLSLFQNFKQLINTHNFTLSLSLSSFSLLLEFSRLEKKMVYTSSGIRFTPIPSAYRPLSQSSFNGDRRSTNLSFLLKKNSFSRNPSFSIIYFYIIYFQ